MLPQVGTADYSLQATADNYAGKVVYRVRQNAGYNVDQKEFTSVNYATLAGLIAPAQTMSLS